MGIAHDNGIADAQRTALHNYGGHRAATAVKVCFNGNALGSHVRVGHQFQRVIGCQKNGLQQVINV